MAFWNNKKKQVEERSSSFDYLMYNGIGAYSTNKALLLSTVYRCGEVISNSVAQLPLETYKLDTSGYKIKFTSHPTYRLLNYEPNSRMTKKKIDGVISMIQALGVYLSTPHYTNEILCF